MIVKCLSVLVLLSGAKSMAQENLVPNPSFEEYIGCPSNIHQLDSCKDWSPGWGSCDYYNECHNTLTGMNVWSGAAGVPQNLQGYLFANTGVAYAGFVANSNSASQDREFIQTLLVDSLKAGVEYEISMYLSIPKGDEEQPIGKIGVHFTTDTVDVAYAAGNMTLCCEAHVEYDTVPTQHFMWMKLSERYIATGGERLMIIGNFNLNHELTHFYDNDPYWQACYFYVDDVSVIEVKDSIVTNEPDQILEMPNIFTPNGDLINDVFVPVKIKNTAPTKLQILNRWGQLIFETDDVTSGWDGSWENEDCSSGVYYWRLEYLDINEAFQHIHGVVQLQR